MPYETNARDKAWADAIAKVGQAYPGAAAVLTLVQKIKDDIIAAQTNPKGEING